MFCSFLEYRLQPPGHTGTYVFSGDNFSKYRLDTARALVSTRPSRLEKPFFRLVFLARLGATHNRGTVAVNAYRDYSAIFANEGNVKRHCSAGAHRILTRTHILHRYTYDVYRVIFRFGNISKYFDKKTETNYSYT